MLCLICHREVLAGEPAVSAALHRRCFDAWRPAPAIPGREEIPRKPLQSEDATPRYERFWSERKVGR